jgi:hypothetical protein
VIDDVKAGPRYRKDFIARKRSLQIASKLAVCAQYRYSHRLKEHHTFACDFDATAAARVRTANDVIDADHVVSGIFESRTILFIGPGRQRLFLRAPDPTDRIFRRLAA